MSLSTQNGISGAISEIAVIPINKETIRMYLCKDATDTDLALVLELCKHHNLNPFIKDVHIVKFGASPAQIIISRDFILKKASSVKSYRGFKSGVIVEQGGKIVNTAGLIPPGSTLLGGWATVRIENREDLTIEVNLGEYNTNQSNWKSKPGTMITKVAEAQAHRKAFPDHFQGLYEESEAGAMKQAERFVPAQEKVAIQNSPEKLSAFVETIEAITDHELLVECMNDAKGQLSDVDYKILRDKGLEKSRQLKELVINVEPQS